MTNSTQTLNPNQKQQDQNKDQYSNQSNPASKGENVGSKVGNNIEKDEPRAQNRPGMKDEKNEGGNCSSEDSQGGRN